MKIITRLVILIGLPLLFAACPRGSCPDAVDAIVRDYTGLSGCTWVLELQDGQRLEPVNLHEFDVPLRDNLPVRITYSVEEDMFSICMVGPMVNLQCIEIVD
jgi:hypothetical protein